MDKRFSPRAIDQLGHYHWPGNVRELRNVVQRAYVMAVGEVIDDCLLPRSAAAAGTSAAAEAGPDAVVLPIGTSMAAAERMLILATLRHFRHHKERTAATLGISLKTLYNRLKEYAAGDTEAAQIDATDMDKP